MATGVSEEVATCVAEVDRTYFSRVGYGLVNPSFTMLETLAAALHVPPGRFLDD